MTSAQRKRAERLLANGESINGVAKALGLNWRTVRQAFPDVPLRDPHAPREYTPETLAEIQALLDQGMSMKAACTALGHKADRAKRYFPDYVTPRDRPLAPERVDEIIRLRGEGMSVSRVAAVMGIGYARVKEIAPDPPRVSPVPLHEAFKRSGLTASRLARKLGWQYRDNARGTWVPDTTRVNRALGRSVSDRGRGYGSAVRETISYDLAERVAHAMGYVMSEIYDDLD